MVAMQLDTAAIKTFGATLRGSLMTPGDPAYDETRQIWNAMIDRKPGLIARCSTADDVVSAVNFARTNDLVVAIRGGGHNIAGNAVCDGGLMIDPTPLEAGPIDASALRAFDAAAQAHGLAPPLGINSTTGVAGLTLGGGFGWLSRKHGMTVDNLISADVVTAEAMLVRASARENADLFWGIRGGG